MDGIGGWPWLGAKEKTQERCCMASRPGSGVKVGDTGALIGRSSEMQEEDAAVARILVVSHVTIDQSECSNWRQQTPTHQYDTNVRLS